MSSSARDLQTLFEVGSLGGLSDGQLLDRFLARKEMTVFEAVVLRHGPMVWGVCRRVLRDQHDAEDAFQATFLVLARKASSIKAREKLGNWLYGVAYQTAMKSRATKAERQLREVQVAEIAEIEAAGIVQQDERLSQLDRELNRLPEKYRVPIVLCDLEGKSHKEAAEQLGWPIGTVSGRLSRAKAILAKRLSAGETTHSVGLLSVLMAKESACMPTMLINRTAQAASLAALGRAVAAGMVSAELAALTQGVLRAMMLSKIKIVTAILLSVGLLVGGMRAAGMFHLPQDNNETTAIGDLKKEADSIEGEWKVIAAANHGDEMPGSSVEKLRLVVTPEQMSLVNGERIEFEANYKLDPGHSPMRIDLTDLKSSRTMKGIYRLNGVDLTIIYDEGITADRYPTAFVSEAGKSPNDRMMTLKRLDRIQIGSPARLPADQTGMGVEELQGIWTGVVAEVGGKRASPSENVPLPEAKVRIKDGMLTLRGLIYGNIIAYLNSKDTTFMFKVDASKKPRTIDLTEPPAPDDATPSVYVGIYRLEGDDLTLCLNIPNKKRPTEFKTQEKTNQLLLRLKRDRANRWEESPKELELAPQPQEPAIPQLKLTPPADRADKLQNFSFFIGSFW